MNPATLYGYYRQSLHEEGIASPSWVELTEAGRNVWERLAIRIRQYKEPAPAKSAALFADDPKVHPAIKPPERKRLNKQSRAILELFKQGDVTNSQMKAIANSYTRRVSDIRAAGYVVEIVERNNKTGVAVYSLISSPTEVPAHAA